ncbi:methyltransferase [Streptomyces sp. NPDC001985]|uniref:methyltransferase n=1 Tax=Streptomyces sp. NPDC001985 TaxID=3154406 RepID=UPI00331DC660
MLSPLPITTLMWSHWQTRTLLSAIELGVFPALTHHPLPAAELRERLRIHPRPATDFFDALVALGLLERHDGHYRNTPETAEYLDPARPHSYLGAALAAQGAGLADELTAVLRTGRALRGARDGRDYYGGICATTPTLRAFQRDMTALSIGSARAIAEKFPWPDRRTLADIGCAEGALAGQVLSHHPHLRAIGFDLAPARTGFEEYAARLGLTDRMTFHAGDFFRDELPTADVLVLGHVLHNWNPDERLLLLTKAHRALPPGGAVLVYETLIDDDRRRNTTGLLLSLIMHLEVPGGADYTGADCRRWLAETGFTSSYTEHLDGPESMVVGIK